VPALGGRSASAPWPAVAGLATSAEPGKAPVASEEPLCLPLPDWLHHRLTVTGPEPAVAGFRQAACGAGVTPWVYDYDRMAEDWFNLMVAPPPPLRRTISVAGARIIANQLRDAVWERHEAAISQVGVCKACPFDLHALLPVPFEILRLGPDDPRSLAWLWEHWGTTWSLRQVEQAPLARAEQAELPGTHAAFRCRFWAADWTPWPALAAVRRRWPELSITVQPTYGLDENEEAGARRRRRLAAAGRARRTAPNGALVDDGSLPCRAENRRP
jgi:hypothetical protein